jgi:probable HAF family extracellular repeat protein
MSRTRFSLLVGLAVMAALLAAVKPVAVQAARPTAAYSITDIGVLPGRVTTSPWWQNIINNKGEVSVYCNNGYSAVPDPNVNEYTGGILSIHPVVGENGQVRQLPGGEGLANGLNDQGQVVGFGATPGSIVNAFLGDLHAFRWEKGVLTDLGTFGGVYSGAWGLNSKGQIVGESTYSGDLVNHAAIWDQGTMRDLNDLIPANSGWELIFASGNNDRGQIACGGIHGGRFRTCVLTPTR